MLLVVIYLSCFLCFCIQTVENLYYSFLCNLFIAPYLLLLIHIVYSSASLKQCSGAIVRFSDSSSTANLEKHRSCLPVYFLGRYFPSKMDLHLKDLYLRKKVAPIRAILRLRNLYKYCLFRFLCLNIKILNCKNLNTETEKSEQTLFVQISLSQY